MTEQVRRTDALDRVRLWLDTSESDLGLIEGAPGAGKSVLARQIADTFRPVHFHRCDARDDATISPLRFVAALARALADEIEPFAKALIESSRPDIVINATAHADVVEAGGSVRAVHLESITIAEQPAREAFDRVVRLPLETCELPPEHRLLVVIDGLDESLSYRDRDHLVDLVQHVAGGPAPIRFLVTARSGDARIGDRLGSSFLDVDRLDDDDIYRYAYELLGNLTDDRRHLLATRISEKRNFLYAYHVVADARTLPSTAAVATSELPDGLTEIYRSFMGRELAPDRRDQQWTRDIRPVLGLVACGRGRGVPRQVIGPALGRPASWVDDVLLTCGPFLGFDRDDADGELVAVYHSSFREFLTTDALYHTYETEAHHSLASYLYASVLPAGTSAGYAYALAHLPHHLARARLHAPLIELAQRREFLAAQLTHLADQPFADLDTVEAALTAAADESRPLDVASFLLYLAARRARYAGSVLDHLDRYGPAQAMASGAAYPEAEQTVHDLVVAAWLVLEEQHDDAQLVLETLLGREPRLVTDTVEHLAALLLAIATPAGPVLTLKLARRLLDSTGMAYLAAHQWLLGNRDLALAASACVRDRNLEYRILLAFRGETLLGGDSEDLDEIEQYIVDSIDHRDSNPPPGRLWQLHPELVLAVAMSLAGRGAADDARSVLDEPMAALSGLDRGSSELMLASGDVHAAFRRGEVDAAAGLLADAETAAAALEDAGTRASVLLCLARTAASCGFGPHAVRLAREAYEQVPELDHEVHEDAFHGPCLQGLILDAGRVLAGVGDLRGAVRVGERLLRYGTSDGVDVLLGVATAAQAAGAAEAARDATRLINDGLPRLGSTPRLIAEFRVAFGAHVRGLHEFRFGITRHEVVAHLERALGAQPTMGPLADAVMRSQRTFAVVMGQDVDALGRVLRETPAHGTPAFGTLLELIDARTARDEPEPAHAGRPVDRIEELSRAAAAARRSGDTEGADRLREEATRSLRAASDAPAPRGGSAQEHHAEAETLFSRTESWARLGDATAARDTFAAALGALERAELAWEAFRALAGLRLSMTDAGRSTDSQTLTRICQLVDVGVAFAEGDSEAAADEWFDEAVSAVAALRYPDIRSRAAAHVCTRVIGIRPRLALTVLPSAVVGRPALIGRLLLDLASTGDVFGETGKDLLRQAAHSGEAAVLALGALATSFPDAAESLWTIMTRELPCVVDGRREPSS